MPAVTSTVALIQFEAVPGRVRFTAAYRRHLRTSSATRTRCATHSTRPLRSFCRPVRFGGHEMCPSRLVWWDDEGFREVEKVRAVMSTDADRTPEPPTSEHVPARELARRQGVRPIGSVDELARPDLFDSDDELERFLADLYASRREGAA